MLSEARAVGKLGRCQAHGLAGSAQGLAEILGGAVDLNHLGDPFPIKIFSASYFVVMFRE